jgi:hypothetical protein
MYNSALKPPIFDTSNKKLIPSLFDLATPAFKFADLPALRQKKPPD